MNEKIISKEEITKLDELGRSLGTRESFFKINLIYNEDVLKQYLTSFSNIYDKYTNDSLTDMGKFISFLRNLQFQHHHLGLIIKYLNENKTDIQNLLPDFENISKKIYSLIKYQEYRMSGVDAEKRLDTPRLYLVTLLIKNDKIDSLLRFIKEENNFNMTFDLYTTLCRCYGSKPIKDDLLFKFTDKCSLIKDNEKINIKQSYLDFLEKNNIKLENLPKDVLV